MKLMYNLGMLKTINSTMTHLGKVYEIIYHDADSFDNLDPKKCTQAYGVCFEGDRMLISHGGKKIKAWGLVGGTIKPEETFEETLKREVTEESNMRVLKCKPVGYQEVFDGGKSVFQLRYVCLIKPLGPFEKDPAGGVIEIKLINPKDYKKYFDWGIIGKRIIERSLELKNRL